jgi:hypothetical protein
MQAVTKYRADDGTEWRTPEEATKRDALCWEVGEIMAPLGKRHTVRSGQFWQHDPAVVIATRVAVLKLCARHFPEHEIFRHEPCIRSPTRGDFSMTSVARCGMHGSTSCPSTSTAASGNNRTS